MKAYQSESGEKCRSVINIEGEDGFITVYHCDQFAVHTVSKSDHTYTIDGGAVMITWIALS